MRKVSPDGHTDGWTCSLLVPSSEPAPPPAGPAGPAAYRRWWRLVFPSAGRMESKGQKWKPQKTVCVSGGGAHFSSPPCCPSFIFSPLHSPLNFPSPTFPPLPLVSSRVYRGGARRSFWFWAQMALACLWQRIKPPVSPFASMCKRSGQRTSNRRRKKKGGRNV